SPIATCRCPATDRRPLRSLPGTAEMARKSSPCAAARCRYNPRRPAACARRCTIPPGPSSAASANSRFSLFHDDDVAALQVDVLLGMLALHRIFPVERVALRAPHDHNVLLIGVLAESAGLAQGFEDREGHHQGK